MTRAAILLGGLLVFLAPADAAVRPKESAGTMDRTLRGEWRGGACQGTWTFRADGTFELKHYTPGNDTLKGTWGVRWTAVPPTLGVTISASSRLEHVDSKWELKIIQLDDEALTYERLGGQKIRFERAKK
jgi:hypothetical protein